MPELQDNRAARAVNPLSFELSILGFVESSISVETRPDIGAIELIIRSGDTADVVVLAPEQAVVVAQRLISAVLALAAEGQP